VGRIVFLTDWSLHAVHALGLDVKAEPGDRAAEPSTDGGDEA
jgi:hypothetical protein